MLMMTPDFCCRMNGSTCLHAMIVPRRLMAQMRSKASSLSSSSGASPPARLTPTLLCRMSMRPQRRCAAATAAASVASLVTSASKATHSPPSSATIAAVSSADSRRRSTASTFAPSRAKRKTVARPLPMPSPGLWPAPTTMATFSASRMADPFSILRQRKLVEIVKVVVLDIDLHRRQQPDDAVIEGDGDDQIRQALGIEPLPQLGKGRVRDRHVRRHLARRAQHRLGERLERARLPCGFGDHGPDIVVGDAEIAAGLDVARIFLGRAGEIADLEDRPLP